MIEQKLDEIEKLVGQMTSLMPHTTHMVSAAARVRSLCDEIRRAVASPASDTAPTSQDLTHLVIGQCPECFAINRHEPNCERQKR